MIHTITKYISTIILALFLAAGTGLYAQDADSAPQPHVPDQLIIKTALNPATVLSNPAINDINDTVDSAAKRIRAEKSFATLLATRYAGRIKSVRPCRIDGYMEINTHTQTNLSELADQLRNNPQIVDVSLNYIASIHTAVPAPAEVAPPDDAYFPYQYALNNTGQNFHPNYTGFQGSAGADINALEGWYYSTGGSTVIIAIVDSGVAPHDDLASKLLPGYNFIDDNDNTADRHGHGTFVASIAAADTNNGIGIAGVAWNSRILPVRVMDEQGNGSYVVIGAGIRYAADQGAKVINLSVGGRNPSFILEDAVQYAYQKGAVLVSSTGNFGNAVTFPAAYDAYCLAVGATDADDQLALFSNTGPEVDLTAPGKDVVGAEFNPLQPTAMNRYTWDSGTSYASPVVAGAAALLIALKPFLTNDDVMDLLRFTADDVNQNTLPGIDTEMGYGRLNLKTLLGPYSITE